MRMLELLRGGLLLQCSIVPTAAAAGRGRAPMPHHVNPVPQNYTVLKNTDFFGSNVAMVHTPSIEECAQACWEEPRCVCVSWNGPGSAHANGMCNLHCSVKGKRADKGELAAVIRVGSACGPRPSPSPPHPSPSPPPAPPPPSPPPVPIPPAWLARERGANMYIAGDEPLVVGNGYVAAMTHTGTMYVAGVFNGDLDHGKEPVRAAIPSFWDGFVIASYLGDSASSLDVGVSAVLTIGEMRAGAGVLEARRYAHRSMPHVIGVDFIFDNSAGATPLVSNISQPVAWGGTAPNISTPDTTWTHVRNATSAGWSCWAGHVTQAEDTSLPLTTLGLCTTDLRTSPLVVRVPPGEIQTYSVLAAIHTTMDHPAPFAAAAKDLAAATALTAQSRWESHVAKMDEALESGIEVTGNHALAKLVNASFHTLVAALRAEPEFWYSTSPGGLATDCYHGHTFWDMETWMYPNLLFFHPDLARGTVMYRAAGLPWAKKWARETGRVGARYPWQTESSGKVASRSNENEIHIVGDVALSMWQYFAATANTTWLRDHGLPILQATAEFFAGWAQPNEDGSYSLNRTQGPDEDHTGNDSGYVNAAAALNLRSAANFSAALGRPYPTNWTRIADNVRIPFDADRQLHLEFAGWTDAMKAKQADTIMLGYPLGVDMPATVRKHDLDYYANHTGGGPSMTWSMYLVGYLEVGELEQAAAFFNKSWLPYVNRATGDFGGDCGGNFLTGAGGFLQGLWAGWAGMRLRADSLDFLTPRVPATTDGLKLRGVAYLGLKFDLELAGQACFRAWPAAAGADVAAGHLRTGVLGSGQFAPLSATGTCYELGTSVRMVGAP